MVMSLLDEPGRGSKPTLGRGGSCQQTSRQEGRWGEGAAAKQPRGQAGSCLTAARTLEEDLGRLVTQPRMQAALEITARYCSRELEQYGQCVAAKPESWQRDCHHLKMSIAQCTSAQ